MIRLVFEDFVDVQTRLVLLPLIEEEGCGAIIAAFTPPSSSSSAAAAAATTSSPETSTTTTIEAITNASAEPHDAKLETTAADPADDASDVTKSSTATPTADAATVHPESNTTTDHETETTTTTNNDAPLLKDDHNDHQNNATSTNDEAPCKNSNTSCDDNDWINSSDLIGNTLVGITVGGTSSLTPPTVNPENDFASMDFTDILAAIRTAPTPIVLWFEAPSVTAHDDEVETEEEELPVNESMAATVITTGPDSPEEKTIIFTSAEHEDEEVKSSGSSRSTSASSDGSTDPVDVEEEEQEEEDEADKTNASTTTTPATTTTAPTPPAITRRSSSGDSSLWNTSWGERFRNATSMAQLAAEAASGAASVVVTAATEAKERAISSRLADRPPKLPFATAALSLTPVTMTNSTTPLKPSTIANRPTPGLFLQTSLGAFLPLGGTTSTSTGNSSSSSTSSTTPVHSPPTPKPQPLQQHRSSEFKVTTSSLILVRTSESQPCPPRGGYAFQWYRIESRPPKSQQQLLPSISDSIHSSSSSHHSRNSINNNNIILLQGATNASFQPSATEVGHRLRCVVTIPKNDSDEDEDFTGSCLPEPDDEDSTVVICDTPDVVAADSSLFNGARQALLRGAHFGGLMGRGNAAGRVFRLHLEMGRCSSETSSQHVASVGSSIVLYQVSGQTAEPIHTTPIFRASALSDPLHPKALSLIFPEGLSEVVASTMISVLSTNGEFQLEAQNRLTRETLLLALGIANYPGKPVDLDERTVLFFTRHTAAAVAAPPIDDNRLLAINTSKSPPTSPIRSPGSSTCGGVGSDGGRGGGPRQRTASSSSVSSSCSSSSQSTIDLHEDPANHNHHHHHQKVEEMEQELERLRTKLAKKDKVISQLQRQITTSDSQLLKSERTLAECQMELSKSKAECQAHHIALRDAQKQIESHEAVTLRLKGEHVLHISFLEGRIKDQTERCAELEKTIKNLQNEKAVLSGAVEAREAKLSKMSALQKSFDDLSIKVAQHDALRIELSDTSQRYQDICRDLERVSQFEQECREQLQQAQQTVETLNARLLEEQSKTTSLETRYTSLQKMNQTLKAERNNFKQKSESLSKEIGRICRNGRTINDLEKLIADEDARREEVTQLVAQKRKALEDLHHYRTALEQCRLAQERQKAHKPSSSLSSSSASPDDHNWMRVLERSVELERIVSELTEYVSAKEMQLETLKQVNAALEQEIHVLAQASMSKNEL